MPKRVNAELPICSCCHCTVSYPVFMCGGVEGCQSSYHEECIDPWLENHTTCPNCRQEFVKVKNRSVNNILESLDQPCVNAMRGCKSVLPMKERFKHQRRCKYRMEVCRGAEFGCKWNDIVSKRTKHESSCIYKKFRTIPQEVDNYEQRCDEYAAQTIASLETRSETVIKKIEQAKASLVDILAKYSRIRDAFTTGDTKRFILPFKSDTCALRVNRGTRDLNMHIECESDIVSIYLSGGSKDEYPLAVIAVIFFMNSKKTIEGETSNVSSLVFKDSSERQKIISTTRDSFTDKSCLNIKLVVKIF